MNNTVRTIIVVYIIAFLVICLFFIPCKKFVKPVDPIFTGDRESLSIIKLYQLDEYNDYFYYIDWQLLWLELMSLTVLAGGSCLIFKK